MKTFHIFYLFFLILVYEVHSWSWDFNTDMPSWDFNVNKWSMPSWKAPYCYFAECCDKNYIIRDFQRLERILKSKVYGQHLVNDVVSALRSHYKFKSPKALTLSFHGWPGGGKNYVSNFIAESIFKNGGKSKFVHHFIGRIHFPVEEHAVQYRMQLHDWLKGNISNCPYQLFIFDEVDKMPAKVLNAIKPMIDYRDNVDGVDYTQAVFIFLSNTGSHLVNEQYLSLWRQGKSREELTLSDFESLISKGAFNEEGGFHHSDAIRSNLIDHYIPFLPMQQVHVKACILDEFKQRNVSHPEPEHVQEVLSFIEWGPTPENVFSKSGCKRISSKVGNLVAKYYWKETRDEL